MSLNIPESLEVIMKKNINIISTLIVVAIHNGESFIETKVIGCPLSDHHFVTATLNFNPA